MEIDDVDLEMGPADLEEDTGTYEEFMTLQGCLSLAQKVVTTALAAAKAAKGNYEKVQISVYHEVYLEAEKKVAFAKLQSQQAGKELEELWNRLKQSAHSSSRAHQMGKLGSNEVPASGSSELERIIDESENPAVIDTLKDPALSTNKFYLVDRAEAETALTDLKQVLRPRQNVKGH